VGGILLAAATPSPVAAYTFENIAGKWCTAGGSEQFDRDNMIAIVARTGERRNYHIVSYEYLDERIRVTWQNAEGKTVHTDFAKFSTDGRQMVQLKFERGPRREFHRC